MPLIEPLDAGSAQARTLVHEFFTDVIARRLGHAPSVEHVDRAVDGEPLLGLSGPDDVMLVARDGDGDVLGCGALRVIAPGVGEVKRMYVRPAARGQGLGAALLAAVEDRARGLALTELRLDTRSELAEARALYASRGYREIPAYNDNPYAQHWYVKDLRPGPA